MIVSSILSIIIIYEDANTKVLCDVSEEEINYCKESENRINYKKDEYSEKIKIQYFNK